MNLRHSPLASVASMNRAVGPHAGSGSGEAGRRARRGEHLGRGKRSEGSDAGGPTIGPNSVLQTLRALGEREPPEVVERVRRRARLPEPWPEGLIPEAWFVALVIALREALPASRSEAILRSAGRYTAEYVAQHRIPRALRVLLRLLPATVGVPLLLFAFRRHAWTFAGGGRFDVAGGDGAGGPGDGVILLEGCPTCRAEAARALPGRAGAYYEAAFEGLLRLAAPAARVREVACQATSAGHCRFLISRSGSPECRAEDPALVDPTAPSHVAGEPECASS